MKKASKFLALLLAVLMTVGILPWNAILVFAEDADRIVVIAGSDYQAVSGNSASAANVTAILNQIKKNYSQADGFIFCGDYDIDLPGDVAGGITSLKAAFEDLYGSSAAEIFVQGNHDQVAQGTNGLTTTGAHDAAGYGVYVINEDDYMWKNDNENTVKATADALKSYLDAKVAEGYDKPVFIATHLPLHYSVRTYLDGDTRYAKYLFDVLNEAAGNGLNIIYLYGHDHSQGWDNYLGGAAVYLPVGAEINIADPTDANKKTYSSRLLKFTYMNAGFTGYYADYQAGGTNTSGVDDTLTMTAFVIEGGSVTVERYDANGVHNLKSAGVANIMHKTEETAVGLKPNTTVVASGAMIADKRAILSDSATGIKVKAFADSVSVTRKSNAQTYEGITKYELFDITLANFTGTATVEIPIPAGYATDRIAVYHVSNGLIYADMLAKVENGCAVFKTTHFSDYMLAELDTDALSEWKQLPPYYDLEAYEVDYEVHPEDEIVIRYYSENGGDLYLSDEISADGSGLMLKNLGSDLVSAYLAGVTRWKVETEMVNGNPVGYLRSVNGVNAGKYLYIDGSKVTMSDTKPTGTMVLRPFEADRNWAAGQVVEGTPGSYPEYGNGTQCSALYDDRNTYSNSNYYVLLNGEYYNIIGVNRSGNGKKNPYQYEILLDGHDSLSGHSGTDTIQLYRQTAAPVEGGTYYLLRATDSTMVITAEKTDPATNLHTRGLAVAYREIGPWYYATAGLRDFVFSTDRFRNAADLYSTLEDEISLFVSKNSDGDGAVPARFSVRPRTALDVTVPGTYTFDLLYLGQSIETFTVKFENKSVQNVSLTSDADESGSVYENSRSTAKTGAYLLVEYDNNTSDLVPITLGMLSGVSDLSRVGDYESLTVTYKGVNVTDNFTLHVLPDPTKNDYPEYPDGGSVRVDKNGTGIDFQSSGVAKIELSASGIPVNRGVDVIVMVDTSSSMTFGNSSSTSPVAVGSRRIDMLRHSLKAMIKDFNAPLADGSTPDVKVAIADFNGYKNISSTDRINAGFSDSNKAQIYTSSNGTVGADAFVSSLNITDALIDSIQTQSGTNYDYAFDTIYRLGLAIKEHNAANEEERDLFVIFMSDGAPWQFNYFQSNSSQEVWNKWLLGTWTDSDWGTNATTHKYFYNSENGNSHRMADAIKGKSSERFLIIDPTNTLGEAAKDEGDYMRYVDGLGATMYSIGFCIYDDQKVHQDTIQHVIESVASVSEGKRLYYNADNQDELDKAFTQIATAIRYAASDAYFVDEMGSSYDLQLGSRTYTDKNNETKTITPEILVSAYSIYTKAQVLTTVGGHVVAENDVGVRYGTPSVMEKITFSADGTQAYSSLNPDVNILTDGLICGNYVWYNTTDQPIEIDTNGDGEKDYTLAPETFYWKIGQISDKEFVLSYYVYLTGSMEGKCQPGSYPTNESAILYFTNWLDHPAHLDTVSPVFPWEAATVSYAFYLVDDNGNVIVNQTTGETGSFAYRIPVTNTVVYDTVLLNSGTQFDALLVAQGLLPVGYTLYDPAASYGVSINSNGGGSWTVTGSAANKTTFVTGYHGNSFTTENSEGFENDYTHTTVWFAVKMELKCIPDVVVVDYGIPVAINALGNDMFRNLGILAGVAANGSVTKTEKLADDFAASADLTYGTAEVVDGKVVYTLSSMKMDGVEVIRYAVQYQNPDTPELNGYYYSTITVVPATTIYFEDSFVEFDGAWSTVGTMSDKAQEEDRPGYTSLTAYDANNVYGFDGNYKNFITYSYGSAKRVTVSAANNPKNGGQWPTATFTFTGTGFDIISVTDKTTGTFLVSVEGENFSDRWIVDAYYGFTRTVDEEYPFLKAVWTINANGTWTVKREEVKTNTEDQLAEDEIDVTESGLPTEAEVGTKYVIFEDNVTWSTTSQAQSDTVYQVPVLKSGELAYGTYTVTVTPQYAPFFDHTGEGSYSFYLDAIRIYNPANNSDEVIDYYLQDNEAYPQYLEIRDQLIAADGFGTIDGSVSGAVFIDGCGLNGTMSQFAAFGPNNEVYLDKGQAIAFVLQNTTGMKVASVQIAAKALNGATAFSVGEKNVTLTTATDLYYDVTSAVAWNADGTSKTIIIRNTDGKPVSLTNIKITFAPSDAPAAAPARVRMLASAEIAEEAVAVMQAAYFEMNGADKPVAIKLYGDANSDGKISGLDLAAIRRYLANYDYETAASSTKIADETLSVRDLGKIRLYLAAYDYATGTSGYELTR